ncbi:MAG: type II toxin-antitoxin system RelE/ParE family toxin [Myxococcales bacterium]|nr:type II toxin-antitoxin system RelE/ParE family toxin [Myxococcales bacterium]
MSDVEIEVRVYQTPDGRCPFDDWLARLRDIRAIEKTDARIARLRSGHFGDCKPVGEGVLELRVHYSPGYRIYLGRQARAVVLLLCAGDKRTQSRDIARAKRYWREHRSADNPLS